MIFINMNYIFNSGQEPEEKELTGFTKKETTED